MWTGGLPTKGDYLTYLRSPPPCKQTLKTENLSEKCYEFLK